MLIAWDCRSVFSNMGGIGRACAGWLSAFLRDKPQDWRVLAIFSTVCQPCVIAEHIPNLNLTKDVQFVEAGLVAPLFEQIQLPVLLERYGIDIYFNPCFGIPAIKTVKFQVAVVHDIVFIERPEWVDPELRDYLEQKTDLTLKCADAVFTVSDYTRNRIYELANARNWRRAEMEIISPYTSAQIQPELHGKSAHILYLGALEYKKGVTILLDAYKQFRLHAREPVPKLVLAGGIGGQALDISEEVKKRGLHGSVKYSGYVTEQEKQDLMKDALLFVFPSLYEGYGIPPLEAMAFGIPVIASSATSLPEVLGNAPVYVKPGDAGDLAKAIQAVCDNKKMLSEMRVRGLSHAEAVIAGNQSSRTIIERFKSLK